MRSEVIEFNGTKFRRYPESTRWADRVYFTPGSADRKRGVGRLHEELWIAAHGPIPDGCDIHHADFDALNNSIDNLVCLTEDEHAAAHHERLVERGKANPPSAVALERAAEWHRSPEGRAWHVEHGKRTWDGRQPRLATCEQCGASYQSLDPGRFCSNRCKSAWRRASGLDNVERACECCADPFVANRYDKTRFCGRSCGQRHSRGTCGCVQSGSRRSA